jgi:uncharacterized membrane protein
VEEHEPAEKNYDLERLIFFSDGVFAIVITLLVIELRPPDQWDHTLAGLWQSEWYALLGYAVSFLAVGVYWNHHRRLFRRVVQFRPGLVFFNLLLLGLVVLVPFAAQLILKGSLPLFLALLILIGISQALLWSFAAFFSDAVDRRLSRKERLALLISLLVTPVIAGVVMVVAQSQIRALWVVLLCVALAVTRRIFARRLGLSS